MSNEHAEHAEHHHPSVKTYCWIAFVLFVLTAIEVAIPEIAKPFKDVPDYPKWAFLWSLYGLSIVKFILVVGYFMHLKFDTPFFTHAFSFALVIAVGTFIALLALSPAEPPNQREARLRAEGKLETASAAAAAPEEQEELKPADPERGKTVFVSAGCTACHAASSIPEAVGTTGPSLDGLGQRASGRVDGMDAEAYIKESIEDPYAYVVDGYMKVMPNMRATMSEQEFVDLVALLEGL